MLHFFEWCEASGLGQTVRTSVWLFPVIEALHLLGLSLLGGAVLIVDLRLMGVMLGDQPIATLAAGARPWLVRGVAWMVATGFFLFMSEAVKLYHSPSFWVKITTLPVAIAFTFLVRQRAASRADLVTSWRSRLLGGVSIAIWFTVAAAGRWIGFSS